jgi:hypothetical protein
MITRPLTRSITRSIFEAGNGPTIVPPANQIPPTITGTLLVGDTLTATPGTWSNADTVAAEWYVDGVATGNTSTTYVIQLADAGLLIEYRETATNAGGSVQAVASVTADDLTANVEALFPKYSGVGGMWDFTDASTLAQNSDGTGVVGVGDPVGYVTDIHTGAYPLSQITASKRPTYNGAGITPDGVDDAFITSAIDFTACDKVVCGAGYEKLNDAVKFILELSNDTNTTPGAFYLISGDDISMHQTSASRGTAVLDLPMVAKFSSARPDEYGAHIGRHSIPGSLSEVCWNNDKGNNGIGNKGWGNFGNYPLNVFSRNGNLTFANNPTRRIIVLGIPVAEPQMSDEDIAMIDAWLMEDAA